MVGLICAFTVSCANLKINVDVHNGDLPPLTKQSRQDALKVMNDVKVNPEARKIWFDTFLEEAKNELFERQQSKYIIVLPKLPENKDKTQDEIKILAEEAVDKDWYLLEPGKKSTGLSVRLQEAWKPYDAKAQGVYDEAKLSYQLSSSTIGSTLKGGALKQFRAFEGVYDFYIDTYQKDMKLFVSKVSSALGIYGILDSEIPAISELQKISKTVPGIAASEDVQGKMVGYPIFNPRIPDLSRNPGDWKNFNSTEFSSGMGNAQFVAVREGLLVFHKKGLDFDPTPIVGAGTATAKLGIKVAGAIAAGSTGIPVNLLTPDKISSSQNSSTSSQNFTINEAEIDSMKTDVDNRTEARKKMLSELGQLLGKIETDKNFSPQDAVEEYQRIVYFYLGQLSLTEE